MTYQGKVIRLYLNDEQKIQLQNIFSTVRYLYNYVLELQLKRLKKGYRFMKSQQVLITMQKLPIHNELTIKLDPTIYSFINADLYKALHSGKQPKYKNRNQEQSFRIRNVDHSILIIDNHHIRIPMLGIVYYRGWEYPHETIVSITITKTQSDKYTASLLLDLEIDKCPQTMKEVGIDLGLDHLAVLSDGHKYPSCRFDKELEQQLHRWQRKLSRRLILAKKQIQEDEEKHKKDKTYHVRTLLDFKNYQKAKIMVAKINEKIANQRYNYIQNITTEIVRNYDVIVLEKLNSTAMMKDHRLARSISNASWKMFHDCLKYKCNWYGKHLITINPAYTSQICHVCGYHNERLGLSKDAWLDVREWQCPKCHTLLDRDINAAINILNHGIS